MRVYLMESLFSCLPRNYEARYENFPVRATEGHCVSIEVIVMGLLVGVEPHEKRSEKECFMS